MFFKKEETIGLQRNLFMPKTLMGIGLFFLLLCALLLFRMGYIQQVNGQAYTAMVQNQRMKTIDVSQYNRGSFLDRNNKKITNQPESTLVIFPSVLFANLSDPQDKEALQKQLMTLVGAAKVELADTQPWLAEQFEQTTPFVLARNLTDVQVDVLTAALEDQKTKGAYILPIEPRYSQASFATHIIGFMGEADEAELKTQGKGAFKFVGKGGLEKQYDSILRGKSGDQIGIIVDERGRQTVEGLRLLKAKTDQTLPAFKNTSSKNTSSKNTSIENQGLNLALTLDYDYQTIAETAMQNKNGSAVIMETATGKVLAMVSSPGFDPNLGQPLTQGDNYLNKSLAFYPPASVFKLVLATAAIETGFATQKHFVCKGSITLKNGHQVSCWYKQGHGEEDLTAALGNSCNPYFIDLGLSLGGDLIREYTYKFGLTEQRLIGYQTTTLENNLAFNGRVQGDVANVSIGEKGIRLSPLMVTQLMATIANNGVLNTPSLVRGVVDEQGSWYQELTGDAPRQVVSASSAKMVQGMLKKAVESGTGAPVLNHVVSVGGKSGTTQHQGVWFTGFCPVENPKLAITVYLADGNSGGKDSGSVFKEIVEKIAILDNFAE